MKMLLGIKAGFCAFLMGMSMIGSAFADEKLSGDEIRALFSHNTVAGIYLDGGRFSEFHAADGRALGDNGYALNVDACWTIEADAVCYHYGVREDRRTYCFSVHKRDIARERGAQPDQDQPARPLIGSYELRAAPGGRLNALADILPGNPKQHGDGGKPWSCADLLSLHPADRLTRRSAMVQGARPRVFADRVVFSRSPSP
jgi:hypothetical protein